MLSLRLSQVSSRLRLLNHKPLRIHQHIALTPVERRELTWGKEYKLYFKDVLYLQNMFEYGFSLLQF